LGSYILLALDPKVSINENILILLQSELKHLSSFRKRNQSRYR